MSWQRTRILLEPWEDVRSQPQIGPAGEELAPGRSAPNAGAEGKQNKGKKVTR